MRSLPFLQLIKIYVAAYVLFTFNEDSFTPFGAGFEEKRPGKYGERRYRSQSTAAGGHRHSLRPFISQLLLNAN